MIIEHLKNTTVITQQKKSIAELVEGINAIYDKIQNNNVIVNLFSLENLKAEQLDEFLLLSKKHRAAKHSFVIVNKSVSIEEISEDLILVPTLVEAHDIIEMEEIERDLGF